MKIPDANAVVDKDWNMLKNLSAWLESKEKSEREVTDRAQKECKTLNVATLMGLCFLKNWESDKRLQKNKGLVVLRGDVVKVDTRLYAEFTEHGSSASQMRAAKGLDVTPTLPGWAGQASDAVSSYTQVATEDTPKLLGLPESECPVIWIRLTTIWPPEILDEIQDLVVPFERNW